MSGETHRWCQLCGQKFTVGLGPESYMELGYLLSEHMLAKHIDALYVSGVPVVRPLAAGAVPAGDEGAE